MRIAAAIFKPRDNAQGLFFLIIINILVLGLSQLFQLHLNTYVMCLRPVKIIHFFSAGMDFKRQNRQNLMSLVNPRTERYNMKFVTQFPTSNDEKYVCLRKGWAYFAIIYRHCFVPVLHVGPTIVGDMTS